MNQHTKDSLIVIALLAVKALTTLRTGIDTFAVSGDLLNVLLIDGAFLALWLVAAYGGHGAAMLSVRPFATIAAWALYGSMLVIGWEAHHGIVALAVRTAGGLALAYDTWDLIMGAANRMRIKRASESFADLQERITDQQFRKGIIKAIESNLKAEVQTACDEIARQSIAQRMGYVQGAPMVIEARAVAVETSEYKQLSDGRITCTCGWVSKKAYKTQKKAQTAHAAHTRNIAHRRIMEEAHTGMRLQD